MPISKPESSNSRIIAHIDMDCFYVQVEQRRQPYLRGRPTAVIQYNSWQGGGLIAVGYEARKFGVKRSMRGEEAKKLCPEIQLIQVPVARGKADLSVYRNAGSEVVSVLSKKGKCERASIDEVYLDLTEAAEMMLSEHPHLATLVNDEALSSHILGIDSGGLNTRDYVGNWFLTNHAEHRDKLLACGTLIVSELRLDVLKETEFTCSAGIAHNKMLAKLASGTNKPAQQTVVPSSSVKRFLEPLSIKKMKQLGGKLGTSLQADLGVNTVGDLLQFSEEKLQELYGINTGAWLWNIARGFCGDEVEDRLLSKSHGSGKTFPGPQALKTLSSVQKWLDELCEELSERLISDLEHNKRIAHALTLHASAYKLNDSISFKKFPSKSCPLRYGITKIQEDAVRLFHSGLREYIGVYASKATRSNHEWAITGLSVSASKIIAIPQGIPSIMKYFHCQDQTFSSQKESAAILIHDAASLSSSDQQSYEQSRLPHHGIDNHVNEVKSQQDISCLYDGHVEVCKISMGQKPYQSKRDLIGEGTGIDVKLEKQKRKFNMEKRSPSILRFFQSCDSSAFLEQAHSNHFRESQVSSSDIPTATDDDFGVKLPQENLLSTTLDASSSSALKEDDLRCHSWNYKSDEIDPTVLNELPPEIQAEVRSLLQPRKLAKTMRCTSIAHYFLPKFLPDL